MRFLADESCDFAVVRALRAAGHDVMAVSEVAVGASDERVLELAERERRIFLTEDKDFGQLVYAAGKTATGVIFIRFPVNARKSLTEVVLDLVREKGEALDGYFAVVQPGRIRISKSPGE